MKKNFASLFCSLALFSVLWVSCSKDDNNTPPKTKTELLTQGSWRFQSATANGSDISNQDPPFTPCKKDNILTFSASGSGNMNEGATKCNGSDPNDVPFTWNFANSETTLQVSTTFFNGWGDNFTIESLTETQLVVSQGYSPGPGPIIIIRITFQH